jgi:hypothetical protein
MTRMWSPARDKQLTLPKRTSGRSALVWRPVGRAPPSRREPRPAKSTPPRRWEERPTFVCQLYDGSDLPDSDSLQRRRSWGKSTDSASTSSASQAVESGAAPRRLQSLLIRGGGAPNVHVSLVTDGGQGPTPAVAGVGGLAREHTGERCHRRGGGPKRSSPRVGGPEACSPRAGLEACSP